MDISYLLNPVSGVEIVRWRAGKCNFPPHAHVSVYTVGLVLSGSITLITSTRRVLKSGSIYQLKPYEPHALFSNVPHQVFSICVHRETARHHDGFREKLKETVHGLLSLKDAARILAAVDSLPEWQPQMSFTPASIQALRQELETSPENELSLDDMAKRAASSKFHFIRCFKKVAGLTPHRYQLQNRIRKAQRLIQKNTPMAEVALTTGFCDQSHFIHQFEKVVGISPGRYRLRCTYGSARMTHGNSPRNAAYMPRRGGAAEFP